MAVFAFALLASLGYVLVEVLLRRRAPTLELVSVAVGLALAVPVLGGLALDEAGVPLHPIAWSALLAGLTLVGDVVLVLRRPDRTVKHRQQYVPLAQGHDRLRSTRTDLLPPWESRSDSAPQFDQQAPPRPGNGKSRRRISGPHAVIYGLALAIAGGAIWLAVIGAASQKYPGFTELWLTSRGQSTTIYNLGVTNQEGKTEKYRLVLVRARHKPTTWELTLFTGETWQRAVEVIGTTSANLYLLPDLSRPYRHVETASY